MSKWIAHVILMLTYAIAFTVGWMFFHERTVEPVSYSIVCFNSTGKVIRQETVPYVPSITHGPFVTCITGREP